MKFKSTLLGAFASVLAFGAASAADLPSRKGEAVYVPPPPFSWTGWSGGVNGGWGGGSASSSNWAWAPGFAGFPGVGFAGQNTFGTSGFVVGVQDGYLWQFANNVVVGYESDFQYADVRGRENGGGVGGGQRLEWFGTERVRVGYAFGRILPYFTGGLIYGQIRADGTKFAGGYFFPSQTSGTHAGWTLGAGVEYAMFDKISVKAEYLYGEMQGASSFGPGVSFVAGAPMAIGSFRAGAFSTHIARVGLNYHLPSLGSLIGISGL